MELAKIVPISREIYRLAVGGSGAACAGDEPSTRTRSVACGHVWLDATPAERLENCRYTSHLLQGIAARSSKRGPTVDAAAFLCFRGDRFTALRYSPSLWSP